MIHFSARLNSTFPNHLIDLQSYVDKDEVEVFRLLSGAAAEEMGSGNRDSISVVGFIEDAEGKRFALVVDDDVETEVIEGYLFGCGTDNKG
ncbi:hypothetical protein TNCV_2882491 [Trichonephila clavipes]|nr:hypothetical protein TNCV_2882491 [Trichonephila clavipes]